MPQRVNGGITFIRRVPSTEKNSYIEIRVATLTMNLARWWDKNVQKSIDKDINRTDAGWNWPVIFSFTNAVASVLGQEPLGYVLGIKLKKINLFIPCALVQLVENYPALNNHEKSSIFVWFMTTAPSDVLRDILKNIENKYGKIGLPKQLGQASLDIAVTQSFNKLLAGLVGLHADPSGGEDLAQWYQKNRLKNLDNNATLPFGMRRIKGNDGRYYYYTTENAIEFSKSIDHLR